jgi:hypothetical protein
MNKPYDHTLYVREWNARNRGRVSAICRKYYKSNRETVRERQRAYYLKTRDVRLANMRERYAGNKGEYIANAKCRRMAQVKAMPKWANRAEIGKLYCEAQMLSLCTGVLHHVDHIYPIKNERLCGLHVHWNLRVIPAKENREKSNRIIL